MPDLQDGFWDNLLDYIQDRTVVPVVGSELVTVREGDRDVPLYRWVAQRLAADLELPAAELPAGFELNDVVSLHLRRRGEREELYAQIHRLLRNAALSAARAAAGARRHHRLRPLRLADLRLAAGGRRRRRPRPARGTDRLFAEHGPRPRLSEGRAPAADGVPPPGSGVGFPGLRDLRRRPARVPARHAGQAAATQDAVRRAARQPSADPRVQLRGLARALLPAHRQEPRAVAEAPALGRAGGRADRARRQAGAVSPKLQRRHPRGPADRGAVRHRAGGALASRPSGAGAGRGARGPRRRHGRQEHPQRSDLPQLRERGPRSRPQVGRRPARRRSGGVVRQGRPADGRRLGTQHPARHRALLAVPAGRSRARP